jgi:NADPH:quinone reductase-like Zn-dependent oxidoreductase
MSITSTMQAVEVTRYGDPEVLELRVVPRPKPAAGEILVRVRAASVSSGDARIRSLRMPPGMLFLGRLALGWRRPRRPVLGTDLAGEVVEIGAGVTQHRVGDAVVAFVGAAMGAHAELVRLKEEAALPMPDTLTFEQAAALPFGACTALHYLRRAAQLRAGERVLILGASGAVGAAAVQIARHDGADVTAVCSAANAALVSELGASTAIDYAHEDFTQGSARWDVVMDCVGATDYARTARVLRPGGRLLRVVCGLGGLFAALWQGRSRGHRVIAGVSPGSVEDLRTALDLARAGALRPVIDATFPLAQIANAHARVDSGRKRGSVVLRMG